MAASTTAISNNNNNNPYDNEPKQSVPQQVDLEEEQQQQQGAAVDESNAPHDNYNLTSIFAVWCGFGVLFVASALIINADYYTHIYGKKDGDSLLFYISFCMSISSPFVQMFMSTLDGVLSYTSRILTCFLLNTICAISFPLILNLLDTNTSFYLALLLAFIVGVNNAILKVTTYCLFSYFPPRFAHLIVIGKGVSPMIVICLKIVVKLIADHVAKTGTPERRAHVIEVASMIFFFVAAVVPVMGCILYRLTRKAAVSKFYFPNLAKRRALAKQQQGGEDDAQDPLLISAQSDKQVYSLNDDNNNNPAATTTKISSWNVLKKIAAPFWQMTLTFAITYAIYPAVLNKTESTMPSIPNAWYHIWTLLIFATSDLICRSLPYSVLSFIWPMNWMGTVVHLRLAFLPAFYYAVYHTTFSNWVIWVLTAILAPSTGVIFVILLRNYPTTKGLTEAERSTAGGLMSISVVLGAALGNVCAVVGDKIF